MFGAQKFREVFRSKQSQFSPDRRFIPKTEAKQAPNVSPSMHISMFKLIRMILFARKK
jgi:hypothetical protein